MPLEQPPDPRVIMYHGRDTLFIGITRVKFRAFREVIMGISLNAKPPSFCAASPQPGTWHLQLVDVLWHRLPASGT